MDNSMLIERSLRDALVVAGSRNCPSELSRAMEYAVFPGGGRVRPKLCLAVASACGASLGREVQAASASLEFLHCASLVHDDLPCFDGADLRRGKPSVHAAFGEAMAVLAGDALILLAFDVLVRGASDAPEKLVQLLRVTCDAIGAPNGIIAGQAMEFESNIDIAAYHSSKTASMFVASCASGAVCAARDPEPWMRLGEKIGEAYQAIDDVLDVGGSAEMAGKPIGQDVRNAKPSLVGSVGVDAAIASAVGKLRSARELVPGYADPAVLAPLFRRMEAGIDVLTGNMRAA
ncbi:MAG: polyprenyl synthetase family protein [Pseudomonadota bacterium]